MRIPDQFTTLDIPFPTSSLLTLYSIVEIVGKVNFVFDETWIMTPLFFALISLLIVSFFVSIIGIRKKLVGSEQPKQPSQPQNEKPLIPQENQPVPTRDQREIQILSYSLMIVEQKKLLADLRTKVENAFATSSNLDDIKLTILQTLDTTLNKPSNWETYKIVFDELQAGFYEKLRRLYPEITANELRLCALLKLNFSSKDIAELLSISEQSVIKARYRLRKRIGLNNQQADLIQYLETLDANDPTH